MTYLRWFWRHDLLLDVVIYFLTSWRTFWRHVELFDVMAYFCHHDVTLMLWLPFFRHGVTLTSWLTFDVMTWFLCSFEVIMWHHYTFLTSLRAFYVVTNLLMLWRTFDVIMYLWRYDVLFDIMTYLWRHDVTLTSCRTIWCYYSWCFISENIIIAECWTHITCPSSWLAN